MAPGLCLQGAVTITRRRGRQSQTGSILADPRVDCKVPGLGEDSMSMWCPVCPCVCVSVCPSAQDATHIQPPSPGPGSCRAVKPTAEDAHEAWNAPADWIVICRALWIIISIIFYHSVA